MFAKQPIEYYKFQSSLKGKKMEKETKKWEPLALQKLEAIRKTFANIFSTIEYGDLAGKISDYWVEKLKQVWKDKPSEIKIKDEAYVPSDPLSRIQQKTVAIAYADSVIRKGEKTLTTLDTFFKKHFPAVRGLHLLPACRVSENRFNDGFFSQVVRDEIHAPFGTNQQFAEMMERYFSMADFVLNHVDIDNPMFQAYLDGDDEAGSCFYIFSEEDYQAHLADGDFDHVFRPRPFPLFTIFRRKPQTNDYANLSHREKVAQINEYFQPGNLPEPVISLLSVFSKIKNDQMLLDKDYRHIAGFRDYLKKKSAVSLNDIFSVSLTQETRHIPYVFKPGIETRKDLLVAMGIDPAEAGEFAGIYEQYDPVVFGEEVRALTTFSHVQVDLNTTTYKGLAMLADDFSWYLSMDLDMLRLDAANFAFKKWKTSCFGLPQVSDLMKILYLSMECVAPRIVANLEVNDQLGNILSQMADKKAPPPMMYDFHLASMLPIVFNTCNAKILLRIFDLIKQYNIPRQSIRFSLAESHDGKSVRGSLDLLTLAERQGLADTVERNGGKVKYKGVPARQYAVGEFAEVCSQAGIDYKTAKAALFDDANNSDAVLCLKQDIGDTADMAQALGMPHDHFKKNDTLKFFTNKVLYGKEPYELCTSTIDALTPLENSNQTADRYLAFYTLAFALMGRNVKSVYFNDLLGLPNDYARYKETGELRDIKRTKSVFDQLETCMADSTNLMHIIARDMNNLIALVDADPALGFRGNEAEAALSSDSPPSKSVAIVHNFCDHHHTLIVVNLGPKVEKVTIDLNYHGLKSASALFDNIGGRDIPVNDDGALTLTVGPFARLWMSRDEIKILFVENQA